MRSAGKTILLPTNKGPGEAPRVTDLQGRATSDHSQKPLSVTQRKRKRVTRLSGAERSRRWRKKHRAAHKAQQRDYRRRKRQDQQEADALNATARRCREDQELQERVAASNKAIREIEARLCAAEGPAKVAGVSIERWLDSLPAEEASKYADLRERLIARERLNKEAAQVWEELGYDPFTGLPLKRSQRSSPAPQQERALTPAEAWAKRLNAAAWERARAADELQILTLSNGMILD
jgi:hypothetical protein